MPLTSLVVGQMMARFRTFISIGKKRVGALEIKKLQAISFRLNVCSKLYQNHLTRSNNSITGTSCLTAFILTAILKMPIMVFENILSRTTLLLISSIWHVK